MCVKYNTVFTNDKINCGTQIIMGPHTLDCLSPMMVNGVTIDAEGFECLSIDKPETHSEDTLSIFDYDINKYGSYILKNYRVRTEIPVDIIEKSTGKESIETIIIEMDNTDNKITQTLKILDTEIVVNDFYLEEAFYALYRKVNKEYVIKICAFCGNFFGSTFGGVEFCNQPTPPQAAGYGKVYVAGFIPFIRPKARMRRRAEGMNPSHNNQLCFEKISGEYRDIAKKTKYAILELMGKHPGKYRAVYLTCSCNQYIDAQGGT